MTTATLERGYGVAIAVSDAWVDEPTLANVARQYGPLLKRDLERRGCTPGDQVTARFFHRDGQLPDDVHPTALVTAHAIRREAHERIRGVVVVDLTCAEDCPRHG